MTASTSTHCKRGTPDPAEGRPALTVAAIFREHLQKYHARYGLTEQQWRIVQAIIACRTAKLGGHLCTCQDCGQATPLYNSCRNRHCPTCQIAKQVIWLAKREHTILPTHYFHVVLTLPEQLREVVRQNSALLLALLMRCAASTLLTLGRDPKRLGARLGITTVLHTWTRTLEYHPHVHCIVTGGGLHLDGGSWVKTHPGYLFPAEVIRRLFRGRFMSGLRALYAEGKLTLQGNLAPLNEPDAFRTLKEKLYATNWVVYAKPPFGGPRQVFAYLGRYTHRVGLTNARLQEVAADSVTFTTKQGKTTTVTPVEFMRRFLLHVLPARFVKIRHYGLFAGKQVRDALPEARRHLEAQLPIQELNSAQSSQLPTQELNGSVPTLEASYQEILLEGTWEQRLQLLTGIDVTVCRFCGSQSIERQPLARRDTS